jgi:integrase/recombinase XerD
MSLWEEHALAMRRRGLAEGTVRTRYYLISGWLRWLKHKGVTVWAADAELVEMYLDNSRRGAKARSCTTSHLHMFYKWAIAKGYTASDPTLAVERPRLVPGLPRPIHATDLQLALVFAQEGPAADPRMEAALLLGAVSGLRCCELARLRWADIEGGQARVLGKGSKERVIPLNGETLAALDRIERTTEYVLQGWQANGPRAGELASRRFTAHFRAAGVNGTAHRLRHRAATEALRKCHDLRLVQTLLGHGSPSTTAIYTLVDSADLRSIIADVNPTINIGADLL